MAWTTFPFAQTNTDIGGTIAKLLTGIGLPAELALVLGLLTPMLVVVLSVLTGVIMAVWGERNWSGRMQQRWGPTIVGLGGSIQGAADGQGRSLAIHPWSCNRNHSSFLLLSGHSLRSRNDPLRYFHRDFLYYCHFQHLPDWSADGWLFLQQQVRFAWWTAGCSAIIEL
jgi:hypothetical protein